MDEMLSDNCVIIFAIFAISLCLLPYLLRIVTRTSRTRGAQ